MVAFGIVTVLAWGFGKVPTRRTKLWLLPWLEFLCACLTLLIGITLLRVSGASERLSVFCASVAWMSVYLRRARPLVEWVQPVAGMLVAWALHRLRGG